MLTVIVFIFAVCWMPYHVYFFVQYHAPSVMHWAHSQSVFLSFYLLAMSHALVNPVILFTMIGRFRMHLQKLVAAAVDAWCSCLGRDGLRGVGPDGNRTGLVRRTMSSEAFGVNGAGVSVTYAQSNFRGRSINSVEGSSSRRFSAAKTSSSRERSSARGSNTCPKC